MRSRTLVLGIGNPFRRDDGAGPAVAESLRATAPPGVTIATHHGEATGVMAAWEGFDAVFAVDATAPAGRPGAIRRFDAAARPLPAEMFRYSSHVMGLAEAVEVARALGSLPRRLVVYGLEGCDFGAGQGLSAQVAVAARDAAVRILAELGR